MGEFQRFLPDLVTLWIMLAAQVGLYRWVRGRAAIQRLPALGRALGPACVLSCLWVASGALFSLPALGGLLVERAWLAWLRGAALAWGLASTGTCLVLFAGRFLPDFDERRRRFLQTAGTAFAGAPFAAVGFGVLYRADFRVREIDIPIANLPADLDGLRFVQLSDIHLSPFLSEAELARVVDMANELRPHLMLVTGDLITRRGDPLDACLRQLARLKSEAGVLGCLGNHEIYARAENYATREGSRRGIHFLRGASRQMRFGSAIVNFVGVDYQRMSRPYLTGAERFVLSGAVNILLSHNPDVFPVAARMGYDLTIAGHTHGGQITVEILHQNLNIARFYTPYVYGLYRQGAASIYVTRGIGTVGLPARIGAPPEIAALRLCAT